MKTIAVAFAVLIAAPRLEAQLTPTRENCDRSIAAIEGARLPDPEDVTFRPWLMVSACGARGDSAAARTIALPSFRSETDSNRVDAFISLFRGHRSRVFFAALRAAAAANTSGMVKSRVVQSLGVLWEPRYEFDPAYFARPTTKFCSYRPQSFPTVGSRSDLPADALQQVLATMQAVESSGSNTTAVRGLARCWRVTLERTLNPDAKQIKLKHVCANTFRVDNDNAHVIQVAVAVEGTSETHAFEVPPRSSRAVSTLNTGHVRLLFQGIQIDKKHTAGNSC